METPIPGGMVCSAATRYDSKYVGDGGVEHPKVVTQPTIPFAVGPSVDQAAAPVPNYATADDDALVAALYAGDAATMASESYLYPLMRRNVFSITDPSGDDEFEEEEELLMNGQMKIRLLPTGRMTGEKVVFYDEGEIDTEHAYFGDAGSAMYWDVVVVKDSPHKGLAWAGVPFRSPLFRYEFNGGIELERGNSGGHRKLYDFTVARCTTWDAKPLPLTLHRFKEMMLRDRLHMSEEEITFVMDEGPWNFDETFLRGDQNFQMHEYEVTRKHIQDCQRAYFAAPKERPALCKFALIEHDSVITRFFFGEVIQRLSDFYADRVIFSLLWSQLERLDERLRTNPFCLCFEQIIDVTTTMSDIGGTKRKVPELNKELYIKAVHEFKPKQRKDWHIAAVTVYGEMRKQLEEGKHTYSTVREICLGLGAMSPSTVADVVTKLCDLGVLTQNGTHISLTNVYEWDVCMAAGLRFTLRNYLANPANVNRPGFVEQRLEDLKQNTNLVEEQLRAMRSFLTSPFTLIQGPAGSGKTTFIKEAIREYEPSEVLLTAFQGKNSGDLGVFMYGRAFTTHMLLYAHAKTCECMKKGRKNGDPPPPKPPSSGVKKTPGEKEKEEIKMCDSLLMEYRECIFENVRILVVDEMSVMYTEPLSKLICAMAVCGKLEKIIYAGDGNQLPSIQAGNLLGDLDDALDRMGCVVRFKENHRVNPESKQLLEVSKCVAEGRPQDIRFDGKVAIHVDLPEKDIQNKFIADRVIEVVQRYSLPMAGTHFITRTNESRKTIARALDKYYLKKIDPRTPFDEHGFHVGLKLMFKRNIYPLKVLNNEILLLKSIQHKYVKHLEDGRAIETSLPGKVTNEPPPRHKANDEEYTRVLHCALADTSRPYAPMKQIPLDKETRRYVSRASATTNHAFQGGQIHTIVLVMPYVTLKYDTRKAIYTAFTRGQCRLIYIGKREWLEQAVNQLEPLRRTDLVDKIFNVIPEEMLSKLPGRQKWLAAQQAKKKAEDDEFERLAREQKANEEAKKRKKQSAPTAAAPSTVKAAPKKSSAPPPPLKKQKVGNSGVTPLVVTKPAPKPAAKVIVEESSEDEQEARLTNTDDEQEKIKSDKEEEEEDAGELTYEQLVRMGAIRDMADRDYEEMDF